MFIYCPNDTQWRAAQAAFERRLNRVMEQRRSRLWTGVLRWAGVLAVLTAWVGVLWLALLEVRL